MSAAVESMFYVRERPWHGLGRRVVHAPNSEDALVASGLDWEVHSKAISLIGSGLPIHGLQANVRSTDGKVLGVVTNRYKIVQNRDAFAFTDALLEEGVTYETAGSLHDGKKVWMLARLPRKYQIDEDAVESYLLFTNSHNGEGSIKVAVTPIRVVCNNTLTYALENTTRMWSTRHTGNLEEKRHEAQRTLALATNYMTALKQGCETLSRKILIDIQVNRMVNNLLPIGPDDSDRKVENVQEQRKDMRLRYYEAPDLQGKNKSALRFLNAVSDYATHKEPVKKISGTSYYENRFESIAEGHPLIKEAVKLVIAA